MTIHLPYKKTRATGSGITYGKEDREQDLLDWNR